MREVTVLRYKITYRYIRRRNEHARRLSLVALLLGLEANLYVLTIGSNWGRLINEVRQAYAPESRALFL